MFSVRKHRGVFTATLGLAMLVSGATVQAENENLCWKTGESPGGTESWQVVCSGDDWAYAEFQVRPNSEGSGGEVDVHVTAHGECTGDSHMECAISTDLQNSVCIPETSFTSEYDGYWQQLVVICNCFTPDDPCVSTE